MCGITGIFRFRSPPDTARLEEMRDALAARGPDDGHSVRFREGGLGVRRLAIMDPEAGRQPLADGSGRYWVALNGEIYNHPSLRREYAARGVRFRTGCDTEVVAEVVAALGFRRALDRFEGMFVLAVYDRVERVLWLARDRMGEKPLYYTSLSDGTFLFGSELKALLRHPGLVRRVDPGAVGRYLLFEYIPTPRTIYEGVFRLPPGDLLRVGAHGVRRETWWSLPLPEPGSGGRGAMARWARSLTGAFQVSVFARHVSDVPVGYVLSGGVDSASVLSLAARRYGEGPHLHTFTLTFGEQSFDESRAARETAGHFQTDHQEIPFGPDELRETLADLGQRLDEPLGDSSLPATWWLYRHVAQAGFKVVLSGDGGDELLAGYPTYLAHRLAGAGRVIAPAARPVVRRLPVSYENVSLDYQARRFLEGLSHPLARRNQIWLGACLPQELPPPLRRGVWDEVDAHARPSAGLPAVCRAMALDQRLYLGDGVLVKVDRASQAHGVEVRTPFLDYRFVELAASVPVGFKLRGRTSKAVWKQATRTWLPAAVLNRPKKGFGTPVGPWLRGPLAPLLRGLEEVLEPWLPPEQVRGWIREHRQGRADHRRRLWSGLVLARWLQGPWGPY